jgi:transcriptional regulator with XRE-family HTH domain
MRFGAIGRYWARGAGMTQAEIAHRLGIARQTVLGILAKLDVAKPSKPAKPGAAEVINAERDAEIRDLADAGLTVSQIVAKTGRRRAVVEKVLARG